MLFWTRLPPDWWLDANYMRYHTTARRHSRICPPRQAIWLLNGAKLSPHSQFYWGPPTTQKPLSFGLKLAPFKFMINIVGVSAAFLPKGASVMEWHFFSSSPAPEWKLCSLSTLPAASLSWSSSSTSSRPSAPPSAAPWRWLYPCWSRGCWTQPYQILGWSEGGEIASRLQALRQPCFLLKSCQSNWIWGPGCYRYYTHFYFECLNVAIFWTRVDFSVLKTGNPLSP